MFHIIFDYMLIIQAKENEGGTKYKDTQVAIEIKKHTHKQYN